MKKIQTLAVSLCAVVLTIPIFAASKVTSNEAQDQIRVYAAPRSEKLLEKLPGNAALVPIYREKNWIKVGDPKNGKVGWVNRTQVHKAREAFFRPDIQTIYIHTDRNNKGKPELNIVAYRNGKKLSDAQAKRLYEKMRKNQMHQMKQMRYMTRSMDQAFFNAMPFFQPMIVLPAAR